MDGDDNTFTDISITSLKTELADASKFIERDATGAVISGKAVPVGDVVGTSDSQILTNKTIDADNNTITNIENSDIKVGAAIDAAKINTGAVSNTEFNYLDGVTSSIQTQINSRIVGPGSATDEAIARYDTATGKLVQNSLVKIDDLGAVSGATQLNVDNIQIDGNTILSTDTAGDINIVTDSAPGVGPAVDIQQLIGNVGYFNVIPAYPLTQSILTGGVDTIAASFDFQVTTNGNGSQTGLAYVEIRPDVAGSPGVTVLATSDSFDFDTLNTPSNIETINLTFPSAPLLSSATQYWLVLRYPTATNGTGGSWGFRGDVFGGYADGVTKYENPVNTWNANTGDMYFSLNTNEVAAGAQGKILLDGSEVDVNVVKIVNVVDPTADQDAATKKYVDDNTSFVVGDLDEVSFSVANNQVAFANVTGVAFANGVTRSAEIEYSVSIDATADLFESGKILAIQRGADWIISQSVNGDNSQILFDITTSGQLQYKSANLAGFVSGTIKCRAITTSV